MTRSFFIAAAAVVLAAGVPALSPVHADPQDHGDDGDRHDHGDRHDNGRHRGWDKHDDRRGWTSYDYNRPDPRYGDYSAERYYHGGNHEERRLSADDRIYRGGNGQYYCRHSDGTTGLLLGALGGGVLGDTIAPRGSRTLGAVLGAVGGGAIGTTIDRNNVRCR